MRAEIVLLLAVLRTAALISGHKFHLDQGTKENGDLQIRLDDYKMGVGDYASEVGEVGYPMMKRLMGIFRCNGWGPGCSNLEETTVTGDQSKTPSDSNPSPAAASNKQTPEGSSPGGGSVSAGGKNPRPSSGGGGGQQRYQPFFTLTSGGSWGPTGKRSPHGLAAGFYDWQKYVNPIVGSDSSDRAVDSKRGNRLKPWWRTWRQKQRRNPYFVWPEQSAKRSTGSVDKLIVPLQNYKTQSSVINDVDKLSRNYQAQRDPWEGQLVHPKEYWWDL